MSDSQTEIGVGLIGYGETGRRHARAWRALAFLPDAPRVRLIAVADPDTDATQRAVDEAGVEFIASDTEELIAHPAVHALDVCTPASEHAAALRSAMAAGKHVCVSAPLAFSLREAEEISGLASRTAGVKFLCTPWRRLPPLDLARELVSAGFIGEPRRFRVSRVARLPLEAEPGALLPEEDTPPLPAVARALDVTRALAGDVAEVCASFSTHPNGATDGEVESESVAALLRFADGGIGTLEVTAARDGLPESLALEFSGADGALRFDLAAPDTLHIFDATAPPATRGWKALATTPSNDSPVTAALRAFVHAIRTGEPALPNFRDGLMLHRIMNAMSRSASGGGWEPVDLGR